MSVTPGRRTERRVSPSLVVISEFAPDNSHPNVAACWRYLFGLVRQADAEEGKGATPASGASPTETAP